MKIFIGHQPTKDLTRLQFIVFINVLFLLATLVVVAAGFQLPATVAVKFPGGLTSDLTAEKLFVITITGENVIYLNNQIVSLRTLKKNLDHPLKENCRVLIKASQRTSLGRITEIWEILKSLQIKNIHLATVKEL